IDAPALSPLLYAPEWCYALILLNVELIYDCCVIKCVQAARRRRTAAALRHRQRKRGRGDYRSAVLFRCDADVGSLQAHEKKIYQQHH
ncbi:hypothetical protein, partial [Xylella fastidiosa]|uniref:hypothetical protein n=1 Tax=Xylella fastidiosa TaxID=2371 RepID=UPI001D186801